MSSSWHVESNQARSEVDEEVRRPPLAFLTRIGVALLVVAAFLFLFKSSSRLQPRLQAVLDGEEQALKAGDWQAFAAHLDPDSASFWQHQKTLFDSAMQARRRGEFEGIPYPLHVVETGRRDNRAWATVSGASSTGEPFSRVEFFRQVYGAWLHTGPDATWWGDEREQHTDHIVWHYREADAEWVTRIAPVMEAVHARATADLGLDPLRNVVTFEVCYTVDCSYLLFYPTEPTIDLPAPLLAGFPQETVAGVLPGVLVGHLIARAASPGSDSNVRVSNTSALMDGLRVWETERVTGQPVTEEWLAELRAAAARGSFLSLDDMRLPGPPESDSLFYGQSYALVEYLVERSGPDVLPALVRALVPANTLREALAQVLGPDVDLAAFESEWITWMRERYGE